MNWLTAAIISLLSFGLWGLFTKLTVVIIDPRSALVYQTVGVVIIGLITLCLLDFKPAVDIKGINYAIITGIFYGIGCLFYFIAAGKGKITTVVTLTALYPLITIVLSYFLLKETITAKQCVGIALALLSIFMMSS